MDLDIISMKLTEYHKYEAEFLARPFVTYEADYNNAAHELAMYVEEMLKKLKNG